MKKSILKNSISILGSIFVLNIISSSFSCYATTNSSQYNLLYINRTSIELVVSDIPYLPEQDINSEYPAEYCTGNCDINTGAAGFRDAIAFYNNLVYNLFIKCTPLFVPNTGTHFFLHEKWITSLSLKQQ